MTTPYTPDPSRPPPSYPVPGGVPVKPDRPDARPQMLTAKDMLDADVLRGIAINRRLALAALRLAVFAIGTRTLSARIFGSREFAMLATWSGASVGDEATHAINLAIDEAVAALREAGEVSE